MGLLGRLLLKFCFTLSRARGRHDWRQHLLKGCQVGVRPKFVAVPSRAPFLWTQPPILATKLGQAFSAPMEKPKEDVQSLAARGAADTDDKTSVHRASDCKSHCSKQIRSFSRRQPRPSFGAKDAPRMLFFRLLTYDQNRSPSVEPPISRVISHRVRARSDQ